MKLRFLFLMFLLTALPAGAHPLVPRDCGDMEVWDYGTAMCMPLPIKGMPMRMAMIHGNFFFTKVWEAGPRGRDAFSAPNMFMADVGSSLGDNEYINLDFMGTIEKWTTPIEGYPEYLQIGEQNENGNPFLDAQHPHSSPVMGLTLSDTISLHHEKDHVKIWIAPRGQSTDGPVAFMHRPTGMVNPDAPLGHHIGQDVGHISSTVIGSSLRLSDSTIEFSAFNGAEPEPTKTDLPLGTPNSYALRLTQQFGLHHYVMASAAFVKSPEHDEPELDHIWRYSASIYGDRDLGRGWTLHNAFLWGLINYYDHASALNSFAEEFWAHKDVHSIWGRIEVLQRTPNELAIVGPAQPDEGRWVTAATLGYTYKLKSWIDADLALGGSLTRDFLPSEYRSAYGGEPIAAKVFLQFGGMKMWSI